MQLIKTTPLPDELSLIVGDVVHNLHTALDMAIWEIIPPDCRGTDVKFPFYETRKQLEAQLNKGKIKIYAPAVADLIINKYKPYKEGNDSLYGLHRLDVRDKHQLLVLVEERIDLARASAEIPGSGSFGNLNIFIENLMDLNTSTDLRQVKITNYGKPTFTIVFGEGQPFESQSVIPTLQRLSEVVSGCLDNCEDTWRAAN